MDRHHQLEEHLAFTDRAVEVLSDEVALLSKRLADTNTRLAALETRLREALLASAAEHPTDTDPTHDSAPEDPPTS